MIDPNNFFHFEKGGMGKKWSLLGENNNLPDFDENEEGAESPPYFTNFKYFSFFYVSVVIIFAGLFFKLYDLQVLSGNEYRKKADTHSLREEIIPATRGIVYDRNKKVIAHNIPSFQIAITPSDLPVDETKRSEILTELSKLLKMKISDIEKAINKGRSRPFEETIVKENVDYKTALIVESKFNKFSGISLRKDPSREYYNGEAVAHVLGYVGRINEEEYSTLKDDGYLINDILGKTGVESAYEKELKGQNGKQIIEVDASNKVIRKLGTAQEPTSGNNVILSLDFGLQKKMYSALRAGAARAGKVKAVAVATDPETGEILGMVSLPSFDNNLFAKGISASKYSSLANDSGQPLFNRAIAGTYPTGSSIKPIVASAALQEGVVNAGTQIYDPGAITIKNQYNPSIVYRFPCWNLAGHGNLNVTGAIANSCNVFFYTVAGGYKDFKGLGAEKLASYMEKFGLGSKLGIDLPGETSGLVPTPAWKKEVKGEDWYIGDTYLLGIGQANLLATPLQVCSYTATIANGGTLFKPHVLKEILDASGNVIKKAESSIVKKNFISSENINIVKAGMRQTVTSGTAQMLKGLPVEACGKTGTAQFGAHNEKSHAWFTCFAPYKNPKIALTVLVEGGGEGSTYATPIAYEILKYYFTR